MARSPIHNAAQNGNLNRVKALLNQGVPVNTRDNHSWTPLHSAAMSGNLNVVKELLRRGANVNPRTPEGSTPLHYAAMTENLNVVKELLRSRALVNPLNNHGFTPLHYVHGNSRLVHALIKAGANPKYRTIHGRSVDNMRMTKLTRNALSTSRAASTWLKTVRKRKTERMLASPRLLGSTILNQKSIANIARYLTVKKKNNNNKNVFYNAKTNFNNK